jgi:hypothetical protein
MNPIFASVYDVRDFFQDCTPALDSVVLRHVTINDREQREWTIPSPRLKLTTLRWKTLYDQDASWIRFPMCPFDVSGIAELDYGPQLMPDILKLLEHSRPSLARLTVDARTSLALSNYN